MDCTYWVRYKLLPADTKSPNRKQINPEYNVSWTPPFYYTCVTYTSVTLWPMFMRLQMLCHKQQNEAALCVRLSAFCHQKQRLVSSAIILEIELWIYERNEMLYVTSDQVRTWDMNTDELFDTSLPRGQKTGKGNEGSTPCSCLFSDFVSV